LRVPKADLELEVTLFTMRLESLYSIRFVIKPVAGYRTPAGAA
jgi:hypothetical protein